jgi:pimeloyl-ACP methyl ester carboxylesterase
MMGSVRSDGCDLYYEEAGGGVPILLIHPAGATASTWGSATEELARIGRVLTYDRRGYARSGGHPVRSISTHTDCTDPQDLDATLRDEREEDSPGERAVLRRACRHLAHDEERYPVSVLDPAHAVTTGLHRVGGLAGW